MDNFLSSLTGILATVLTAAATAIGTAFTVWFKAKDREKKIEKAVKQATEATESDAENTKIKGAEKYAQSLELANAILDDAGIKVNATVLKCKIQSQVLVNENIKLAKSTKLKETKND